MKIWQILAIAVLAAAVLFGEVVQTKEIQVTAEIKNGIQYENKISTNTIVIKGQLYKIIEEGYITTNNGKLVHFQVLELQKN